MNTNDALMTLGLTEKEARIYRALLSMKEGSAYSIAQKSGVKKPTTYVLLEQLVEKNFVMRIPKVRKQLYVARPPTEVFHDAQKKLVEAETFLPVLLSLANKEQQEIKTLFYEGIKGMKQSWWYKIDELKDTEMLAFYASSIDFSPELINIAMEWNEEAAGKNIHTRAIAPNHPSLKKFRKLDKEHNKTVKVVPYSKYSSKVAIEISEQFVRIMMFKDLQAVILDNPNVAKAMKEIFEMTWSTTTPK